MADLAANSSLRRNLIDDAEYVAAELARGDAVSADVLLKAKLFIDPLLKAVVAAKAPATSGDPEYGKLHSAMVDMMTAIAPVTVSSLRDTETSGGVCGHATSGWPEANALSPQSDDTGSGTRLGRSGKNARCVAGQFSNRLFGTTIAFLLTALGLTVAATAPLGSIANGIIAVLLPVLYGGLGACVYLLRSLHKHIHERTFDRRYQPEYWNRAVLGVVSGGVITVLVNADGAGTSNTLQGVSISALAFLVGYNTDLLFSLIERISNALFPKVPDPPAPDAAVMPAAPPKNPGEGDGADGKKE